MEIKYLSLTSFLYLVSGFSQRCDIVPFSYVYTTDMQRELVKMNFSERESAHIVRYIGGHLGHVQDFLQTMKIANGKLLVRGIINNNTYINTNTYINNNPQY